MEIAQNHAATVRRQGLKRIFQGGLGFLAGMLLVVLPLYLFHEDPARFGPLPVIAAAVPAAWALAGLIELATGRPFSELSDWWDGLRGWQRGLLGTAIALAFFVALIFGITAVLV